MALQVIGAGLPRTGTSSLKQALAMLLGGRVLHMSSVRRHPFDLGADWRTALAGGDPDWRQLLAPYVAAVDWPASHFWRPLSSAFPESLVLLSLRDSAKQWLESAEATILPVARQALAPDWSQGRDLITLLEQFAGTSNWDDRATLMAAYDRHNAAVRAAVPPHRLLEWKAAGGWAPICERLGLPIPDAPFPWRSPREQWR